MMKPMLVGFLTALAMAIAAPAAAQTPPAAPPGSTLFWEYDDADLVAVDAATVAQFLVCVDGQATSLCTSVPVSSGTATSVGVKEYRFRLPALAPGPHVVAVQACTSGASQCSAGAILAFRIVAIADPKRLGIR